MPQSYREDGAAPKPAPERVHVNQRKHIAIIGRRVDGANPAC